MTCPHCVTGLLFHDREWDSQEFCDVEYDACLNCGWRRYYAVTAKPILVQKGHVYEQGA